MTRTTAPLEVSARRTIPTVDLTVYDFGGLSVSHGIPFSGPFEQWIELSRALAGTDLFARDPRRHGDEQLAAIGEQIFRGYDTTQLNTQIVAQFDASRRPVDTLGAGARGFIALKETPFYLEAGGQVSDVGTIVAPSGEKNGNALPSLPATSRGCSSSTARRYR